MATGAEQASSVSRFALEFRRDDRAVIVVPSGELDLASAPEFETAVQRASRSGAEQVIIDLRGVEFIDSTGLRIIIRAHRDADEAGQFFGVVDGGKQVHKLLTLTGVLQVLHVASSPDELLQHQ